jgi:benzoyl-CoA reductase/2-hydroxyglutaryl-CoA dehydratase subunit BcrC/BadD/HgdB
MREVVQFVPAKEPKNRSMPLTEAMVRFVDVAELIKARSVTDEALRDLCEDYRLARETLTRLRKAKPRRAAEISEYSILVSELEDEIIRHLLGSGEAGPA